MTSRKQLELGISISPSLDEIKQNLLDKLEIAHVDFLNENTAPRIWNTEIFQAVLNIGITAMAYEGLDQTARSKNPLSPVPWLTIERLALQAFILEDISQRQFLKNSIFFSNDYVVQKRLGRIVSASVSPAGIYDEREFATAVDTGLVVARPYELSTQRNN